MRNLIILLTVASVFVSCTSDTNEEIGPVLLDDYYQVTGFAQGTTYSIIYQDSLQRDFSKAIDSILKDYDSYLSVYVDTSVISLLNKGENSPSCQMTSFIHMDSSSLFRECFNTSKEIYNNTDGAFNPTVYPLVKYWGFFKQERNETVIDSTEIDSILNLIDFSDEAFYLSVDTVKKGNVVMFKSPVVCKNDANTKLDFNGIAQGHSVDVIGRYFSNQGVGSFMIEIGGEVLCKGVNNKNTIWQIGVDKPIENSTPGEEGLQLIVEVNNKAIATSGNYRKFYEKDGMKYAHTINPKTGFPVQHSLLSVTVVANNCALADGYATAFMVMGMEETKSFLNSNPELDLEVYLIESKKNVKYHFWMTSGFENLVNE